LQPPAHKRTLTLHRGRSQCTFLQMTYTAVNPHACCNRPRPEDAHTDARPSPHPHASPHLTNNDGLRWKTDGLPPANGPPTATPQQRRHSPSTPARGPPRPSTPRPSPQPPPPPSQSQGQVPITEQNCFSLKPLECRLLDYFQIGARLHHCVRAMTMANTKSTPRMRQKAIGIICTA
jgi:hypothetical protein